MTNRANYNRCKLHHTPWHSDIHTPNQLNILPCWLSRPLKLQNNQPIETGANQSSWISLLLTRSINSLSDCNSDSFCNRNSDTISMAISVTIAMHIISISKAISKSNFNQSHDSALLPQGRLRLRDCKAVCEHLSSWYIHQLDHSISINIRSKIVLGCNVCNYISAVDSDSQCSWLVTVEQSIPEGNSGSQSLSGDGKPVCSSYSLLERDSIQHSSGTEKPTSVFEMGSQPLLERWCPGQLSVYSHPVIQHSPKQHNI